MEQKSEGKISGIIKISLISFIVFSLGFVPLLVFGFFILIFITFTEIWHFLLIPILIYIFIGITVWYQILISGIIIHIFNVKYKPGVYIPPHHRRSSVISNEATLSVSHNTVNMVGSFNNRRPNFTPSVKMSNAHNSLTDNGANRFDQVQHGVTTTSVEQNDVFASTDNDALIFEDDEDDIEHQQKKSMFGPYEIYDQTYQKYDRGRKSSVLKEQAVGS